ncbi:MAG: hypothetical protein A2Z34_02835 [Planctomycetes bacterium RBG_16_59_8]|nr:MAG: hypothetical protein A2Z34_02835 [Planctomycetes bacterium RBG_16_59_8]
MIFVDTNVFVIDLRYRRDPDYPANRRFLDDLAARGNGVTGLINLLEICGILSFNLSPHRLRELFHNFGQQYRLLIVPGASAQAGPPSFPAGDLLDKMSAKMASKDAEIALLVERFVPGAQAFVTWNKKHFVGKVPCPVLTPAEYMARPPLSLIKDVESDYRTRRKKGIMRRRAVPPKR